MAQAAKRIEPESSGDDSVSIKRRVADLENEVAEMRQKAAVTDEQLKHVATQADIERLYAAIANLKAEMAKMETRLVDKIAEQTEKIASEGRRHDRLLMGAVGLLIAVLGFLIKF